MRFIHSADWQLGARFAQFGPKAEFLRAARLATLEKVLRKADELSVDAVVIAGDLFEDNQVDDSVIVGALERFGLFPHLPVFVLPGNHDPASGPASIWNRRPFCSKPTNVTVLDKPEVHGCAGAWFITSPLLQKVSTIDPSLRIAELARQITDDRIRIGITHGALAIPARHQPNDFPIALDAATRASLDYLAVGHWHTWQVYDNGKLTMPGTPEPDAFHQEGAGFVALVEIVKRGTPPEVRQIPVSTLSWRVIDFDFAEGESARQSLDRSLAELRPSADNIVVQIKLHGAVSPQTLSETSEWLESVLEPFAVCQIVDQSVAAFSALELEELRREHPLLAQAVADLAQIEHLATGTGLPSNVDQGQVISLASVQKILANAQIELAVLDSDFFKVAQRLLIQALHESTQ
jgi:DNA repair exonuclease SbcCD nuclease subunit